MSEILTASGLFLKLHFTLKTKNNIQVYFVNCKQQGCLQLRNKTNARV